MPKDITFRVPDAVHKAFLDLCSREGITVHNKLRDMVSIEIITTKNDTTDEVPPAKESEIISPNSFGIPEEIYSQLGSLDINLDEDIKNYIEFTKMAAGGRWHDTIAFLNKKDNPPAYIVWWLKTYE